MSKVVRNDYAGKKAKPWQAQFSNGSGKSRYRVKKNFDSKRSAEEWLAKMNLSYSTSLYYNPQMKFYDFYQLWFRLYKQKTVARATAMTYQATYNHVKRYLPATTLANISRPVLQSYLNCLGRDHSAETLRKDLTHIRAALNDAVLDGVIRVNPAQRLQLTATPERTQLRSAKFMPKAQYKVVLNELMKIAPSAERIEYMVLLLIAVTGLRVGEALALTVVDVRNGVVRVNKSYDAVADEVHQPKTPNAVRNVPITPEANNVLQSWISERLQAGVVNPKAYLFMNEKGRLPRATGVNRYFRLLQKHLGFTQVYSVHKLRHFIGSQLIASGAVSVLYVSKMLGHSNPGITQKFYLDVIPDEMQEQRMAARRAIEDI